MELTHEHDAGQGLMQALSSLDISEKGLSAAENTREAMQDTYPTRIHQPSETNRTNVNTTICFLTLPAELRLRVYEDVLLSRFSGPALKYWGAKTEGKKEILVRLIGSSQHTNMGAGLLRTRRQVYYEANHLIYAQNIFHIREAEDGLRFLEQIGPVNTTHIKSITIWVSYLAELGPWLQLRTLAEDAIGLRRVVLGWGARTDCAIPPQRGVKERGLGDNLDFVRTLARVQSLEELVLQGYYAKSWPAHLEKEMGVQVRAEGGYMTGTPLFGDRMTRERQDIFLKELYDLEQRNFEDFQKGTEDLIP